MGTTQQGETTDVAVLERPGIRGLLLHDPVREKIEPLLPRGVSYDEMVSAAHFAARQNPQILDCTPASIVDAVARVLQWGLEIGTTAHLVPYRRKVKGQNGGRDEWLSICTPVADYKGLAALMVASGAVRHVQSRVVYEGDHFVYALGLDEKLEHTPVAAASRGKITHAYCILRLPFGRDAFEVMPIEDIEAIRKAHSKQWGPDKVEECPPWYAKKTVVRQASKLVPKGPRMAAALRVIQEDQLAEFEGGLAAPEEEIAGELTPGATVAQLGAGAAQSAATPDITRGDYAEEAMREASPELRQAALEAAASVEDPYDGEGNYRATEASDELPLGDTRPTRRRPNAVRDGGR